MGAERARSCWVPSPTEHLVKYDTAGWINVEASGDLFVPKGVKLTVPAELVDGMFYSAALGARKPFSDFFRLATQEVGAAPDDIGFIDDVEENIAAANEFGWKALHWTPASRLADAIDAFTHGHQATRL